MDALPFSRIHLPGMREDGGAYPGGHSDTVTSSDAPLYMHMYMHRIVSGTAPPGLVIVTRSGMI